MGAAQPAAWSAVESRVYIVAGQRAVVIPLAAEGLSRGGPVRLDGLAEPANIVWFRIDDDPAAGGEPAWSGRTGRWAVAAERSGEGFWALVIDVASLGRGASVQAPGGPLPLVWIDGQIERGEAVIAVAARQAGGRGEVASLRAMVEPASRWPTERWRAGALLRAIDERAGNGAGVVRSVRGLEDAAEALARQVELRWQVALGRLAQEDEALALRLASRLLAVVDFGVVAAPAWPGENAGIGLLLDALLDPGQRGVDLVVRVEAFLARTGDPVVWVIDDAPADGALVGVAVVDPGRDSADFGSAGGMVRPGVGRAAEALVTPIASGPAAARFAEVSYRTPAARSVRLATGALAVQPPGLDLGPLLREWTMSTWTAGTPQVPAGTGPGEKAGAWTTRARLLRLTRAGAAEWVLYVECAGGQEAAAAGFGSDTVTVWLGERGRGGRVTVGADGTVKSDGLAGGVRATAAPGAGEADGSWTAWVVLGERPAGSDGTLRLAIERRDGRGVRSSFPRPVLPWQREPGRLRVDLTAWGM